ncbi:hypothetical protein C5S31_02975 [ANME-1 cluster archaeon GoMg2]|nr:hypothetical protein [ANME-1 cluster archaeon GoMg2]
MTMKKIETHPKFERLFVILFTVLGIGIGLVLSQSMQKLQMPILELGLIMGIIGLIGISILVWKRDKLQNK